MTVAQDHKEGFRRHMAAEGFIFEGEIIADGGIHYFRLVEGPSGGTDAWYQLQLNAQCPVGGFGHRTYPGVEHRWSARHVKPSTDTERLEFAEVGAESHADGLNEIEESRREASAVLAVEPVSTVDTAAEPPLDETERADALATTLDAGGHLGSIQGGSPLAEDSPISTPETEADAALGHPPSVAELATAAAPPFGVPANGLDYQCGESHPFSWLFPLLEGEARKALIEDVRARGIVEPIVMFEDKVLDGRNRVDAARECGIQFSDIPKRQFEGDDPGAFVVSMNLHRRHLSESQRAMVAAKLANLNRGRPSKTAPIGAVSQADAAALFNVGERSVDRAQTVQVHGSAELAASVEAGQVPVSAAAEVARLPRDLQDEILLEGLEAVREVAADLRNAKPPAGTSAEKAAYRVKVATGGLQGLRGGPRPGRKAAVPRPTFRHDTLGVIAPDCRNIAEAITRDGLDFLIEGPSHDGSRDGEIAECRAAIAALHQLLEVCGAREVDWSDDVLKAWDEAHPE